MSKAMDENMKKQQEFMLEMNRIGMERQIQMQNQMRERQAAAMIAKSREMFYWLSTFYLLASVAMIRGYRKSKNPAAMAPLLPLTFIVGYQGDLAYGTKMNRIRNEAEDILMFEKDLIDMPSGLPTFSSIEIGRMQQENIKKDQPPNGANDS